MFKVLDQEVLYTYSIPFFVFFILAEMFYSYRRQLGLYQTGDVLNNIYFALLNIGLDMVMKGVAFFMMTWAYSYHVFTIQNPWLYWIALLLLQDFAYYVHHYVDHHSRFFWAVHITHHSSEFFNITTGFRSPVLQPLYRYWFFMPVAFLGFQPLHIMFAYSATQIYGTLIHTKTVRSFGIFEWFMVTPSHHRVHHASNVAYLDKNMGMFLIVWDRLFGTFKKEQDHEPVRFGIVSPVAPEVAKHPVHSVTHEFENIWRDATQAGLTMGQRFKYVFGAPGWSHDGSKMTSKQMQAEAHTI